MFLEIKKDRTKVSSNNILYIDSRIKNGAHVQYADEQLTNYIGERRWGKIKMSIEANKDFKKFFNFGYINIRRVRKYSFLPIVVSYRFEFDNGKVLVLTKSEEMDDSLDDSFDNVMKPETGNGGEDNGDSKPPVIPPVGPDQPEPDVDPEIPDPGFGRPHPEDGNLPELGGEDPNQPVDPDFGIGHPAEGDGDNNGGNDDTTELVASNRNVVIPLNSIETVTIYTEAKKIDVVTVDNKVIVNTISAGNNFVLNIKGSILGFTQIHVSAKAGDKKASSIVIGCQVIEEDTGEGGDEGGRPTPPIPPIPPLEDPETDLELDPNRLELFVGQTETVNIITSSDDITVERIGEHVELNTANKQINVLGVSDGTGRIRVTARKLGKDPAEEYVDYRVALKITDLETDRDDETPISMFVGDTNVITATTNASTIQPSADNDGVSLIVEGMATTVTAEKIGETNVTISAQADEWSTVATKTITYNIDMRDTELSTDKDNSQPVDLFVGDTVLVGVTTNADDTTSEKNNDNVSLIKEGKNVRVRGESTGQSTVTIRAQAKHCKPASKNILFNVDMRDTQLSTDKDNNQLVEIAVGNTILIGVTTNAEDTTAEKNNDNISLTKEGKNVRVRGEKVGTANVTINATAQHSKPATKTVAFNVIMRETELTTDKDNQLNRTIVAGDIEYIKVTTNASDFTAEASNGNIRIGKSGDTISVVGVTEGSGSVIIKAQAEHHSPASRIVNYNVTMKNTSLDFSPDPMTVDVGATKELTVYSNGNATGQVANTGIATMSPIGGNKFNITGVAEGRTSISFTSKADYHKPTTKSVDVIVEKRMEPTELTLRYNKNIFCNGIGVKSHINTMTFTDGAEVSATVDDTSLFTVHLEKLSSTTGQYYCISKGIGDSIVRVTAQAPGRTPTTKTCGIGGRYPGGGIIAIDGNCSWDVGEQCYLSYFRSNREGVFGCFEEPFDRVEFIGFDGKVYFRRDGGSNSNCYFARVAVKGEHKGRMRLTYREKVKEACLMVSGSWR